MVMESGFGSWMNDEEREEAAEEEDGLMDLEELNFHLDVADISHVAEVAAVGGALGAAMEEAEREENKIPEELSDVIDQTETEILSDDRLGPIFRDDPEFAKFVHESIQEDMEAADSELIQKIKKVKKK
jgi:hypothetical protein